MIMARQTWSLVGVPAHVGTEWAVVQLPCDHSLSSTNLLDKPLPVGDMFPLQVGGDREQERENKMYRSCFRTPPSHPEQDPSIWERREIKRKELVNKKET